MAKRGKGWNDILEFLVRNGMSMGSAIAAILNLAFMMGAIFLATYFPGVCRIEGAGDDASLFGTVFSGIVFECMRVFFGDRVNKVKTDIEIFEIVGKIEQEMKEEKLRFMPRFYKARKEITIKTVVTEIHGTIKLVKKEGDLPEAESIEQEVAYYKPDEHIPTVARKILGMINGTLPFETPLSFEDELVQHTLFNELLHFRPLNGEENIIEREKKALINQLQTPKTPYFRGDGIINPLFPSCVGIPSAIEKKLVLQNSEIAPLSTQFAKFTSKMIQERSALAGLREKYFYLLERKEEGVVWGSKKKMVIKEAKKMRDTFMAAETVNVSKKKVFTLNESLRVKWRKAAISEYTMRDFLKYPMKEIYTGMLSDVQNLVNGSFLDKEEMEREVEESVTESTPMEDVQNVEDSQIEKRKREDYLYSLNRRREVKKMVTDSRMMTDSEIPFYEPFELAPGGEIVKKNRALDMELEYPMAPMPSSLLSTLAEPMGGSFDPDLKLAVSRSNRGEEPPKMEDLKGKGKAILPQESEPEDEEEEAVEVGGIEGRRHQIELIRLARKSGFRPPEGEDSEDEDDESDQNSEGVEEESYEVDEEAASDDEELEVTK